MEKKKSYKEIAIGGDILEPGSTLNNKTGSWKTQRPVIDKSKCINCMLCVLYCPEACIIAKKEKLEEVDLDYCKGCGICSNICPVKCIKMEEEK